MRRLVALAVALLAGLPALLAAAPARQGEPAYDVYLPLAFRAAARGDLTPAPTSRATRTPTPAPPTETPTTRPSSTPFPTPSPTALVGGSISGHLKVNGTPAPIGLGVGFGPSLTLEKCTGPDCRTIAQTGVSDATGRYVFERVPPLPVGDHYQVVWKNDISLGGAELWIGQWIAPEITAFGPGDDASGGDIELADIQLVSPTHGTGFSGLPIDFTWNTRSVGSETYRWAICECCQNLAQRADAWQTPALGRVNTYRMTQYPPNTRVGDRYRYCWFVVAEGPAGTGASYFIRMLWFYFFDLSRLLDLHPDPWLGR